MEIASCNDDPSVRRVKVTNSSGTSGQVHMGAGDRTLLLSRDATASTLLWAESSEAIITCSSSSGEKGIRITVASVQVRSVDFKWMQGD